MATSDSTYFIFILIDKYSYGALNHLGKYKLP